VHAAPFDATGLVDLKNEGTKRGTCAAIGIFLPYATNAIYSQMVSKTIQDQDARWKMQQEAQAIAQLGNNGAYWSNVLKNGYDKFVPPSQMEDYFGAYNPTYERFNNAIRKNPLTGLKAWFYCAKIYGFSEKL
jgi:hypothetical protein